MPYIGKQLVRGQNRKLDDISSGFNGSQTTFTLQVASQNVTVGSALQLWISLGGVIQEPTIDYTIAGNQITFTTAPAASLDFFGVIQGDVTDTNTPGDATVTTSKLSTGLTVNLADGSAATSSLQLGGTDSGLFSSAADKVNVTTGGVERLEIGDSEVVFNDPSNDVDFRVESNGNANMLFVDGGNDRVGIATGSPSAPFHLNAGTTNNALFVDSSDAEVSIGLAASDGSIRLLQSSKALVVRTNGNANAFGTGDSEALRVDSSGRLLIGTSSDVTGSTHHVVQAVTTIGGRITLARNDTSVTAGDVIGQLGFSGNDANGSYQQVASITCEADDAHADNDKPGRLRFMVTADGGSSPTERMRIDSSGNVGINQTPTRELSLHSPNNNNALIHFTNDDTGETASDGSLVGIDGNEDLLVSNQEANKNIRIFNNGAERCRIDSSGNVGIGTSSPAALGGDGGRVLHLAGANNPEIVLERTTSGTEFKSSIRITDGENTTFCIKDGSASSINAMSIDRTGRLFVGTTSELLSGDEKKLQITHADAGAEIILGRNDTSVTAGNSLGGIKFVGNDSNGTYQQCAKIEAIADGTHQNNDKSTRLAFSVTEGGDSSPTERMRISQNGVFNHFTDDHFTIRTLRTGTGPGILSMRNGATGISDGTQVFVVRADGDCENTNNSYGALSDIKLKENIIDASSQWDDLKAIQVRKYNFKEETRYKTHTQLGVVAQEVELVSPGLVSETPDFETVEVPVLDENGEAVLDKNGEAVVTTEERDLGTTTKSVNYSVLYMKAVKALQEAMDRIETLEAKVAALEAE